MWSRLFSICLALGDRQLPILSSGLADSHRLPGLKLSWTSAPGWLVGSPIDVMQDWQKRIKLCDVQLPDGSRGSEDSYLNSHSVPTGTSQVDGAVLLQRDQNMSFCSVIPTGQSLWRSWKWEENSVLSHQPEITQSCPGLSFQVCKQREQLHKVTSSCLGTTLNFSMKFHCRSQATNCRNLVEEAEVLKGPEG